MKKLTIMPVFGIALAFGLSCMSAACSITVRTTAPVTATTAEITETQASTNESTSETTAEITTTQSDGTDWPESFPLLDSSTARIPITNALYAPFTGEYGLPGPKPICSKTHQAWLNLADGSVDLILCIAPTVEEKAYLYEKQVDVEMRLYGCDGLVFLGNSENPVKNLTQSQIKGIYRGEIWFGCEKSREIIRDNSSLSLIFSDPILLKTSEKAP